MSAQSTRVHDDVQGNVPGQELLSVHNVTKRFGNVNALTDIQLHLKAGSAHALMGENGAGKSTLIKVITGLYTPDAGEVRVSGEQVEFQSTSDSKAHGISVVYQEPTLLPDLTVAENLFIDNPQLGRFGNIDRKRMRSQALAIFERLGINIDPDRQARGLTIADQQMVEIAKAVVLDAKIFILDEPTATLSPNEVQRLFQVVRDLRAQGCAILFVSHRFEEVWDLCDEVTVMRDGMYIATDRIEETTVAEVVQRMVGRKVETLYPRDERSPGSVLLEVKDLTTAGEFSDVSLSVRQGEIVGLAGLIGAGRSEVARAIMGVDSYDSGQVLLSGSPLNRGKVGDAINAGMGFVPEDRRQQGLLLSFDLIANATLTIRKVLAKIGLLRRDSEEKVARRWFSALDVKAPALDVEVSKLSGGNQQKIVLSKWLATQPRLLVVDEPTRGVDVGAKAEVHRILNDLTKQGVGILMISSDLPEILGMSDRIYVMREGSLVAEYSAEEANPENVMSAATQGNGGANV